MKKIFLSLVAIGFASTATAAPFTNCTVQFPDNGNVVTKQCFIGLVRHDKDAKGDVTSIGVKVDDKIIVFNGHDTGKDKHDVADFKVELLTLNVMNSDGTRHSTTYDPDGGICRYKEGNAVSCKSNQFMLNAAL